MIDVKSYVKSGGGVCPYCKSWELDGSQFDTGSGEVSQEVTCLECERSWMDIYKLVHVKPLEAADDETL